jgi:uncharacterized phosphosugar-binding protein
MSTINDYIATAHRLLDRLAQTQAATIEQAADLVIHAFTNKGAVYCSGLGHGIDHDFINRAGGLAAVQSFTWRLDINDPVARCLRERPADEAVDRSIEAIRLAVRAGNLRRGDVMLIGSVSGRNAAPVELGLACRQRGIKTIGFTARDYSARTPSQHPSGTKLCDAVDVAIDICVPYGDAGVAVAGMPVTVIPLSGLATVAAGWMLWGRVMEKMAAAGKPPTVFKSINSEGGKEFYDKAVERYHTQGY